MKKRTFLKLCVLIPGTTLFAKTTLKEIPKDSKLYSKNKINKLPIAKTEVISYEESLKYEKVKFVEDDAKSVKKTTKQKRITQKNKRTKHYKKRTTKRKHLKKTGSRKLNLVNSHTGEKLKLTYWENGRFYKLNRRKINHFFRDFRRNKSKDMDHDLLHFLYSCQQEVDKRQPLVLLSGYRTKRTNKRVSGAKHSFHMKGMAADIRPLKNSRHKLNKLQKFARRQRLGGVGYYPKNGFVHLDAGPARHWRG